MESKLMRLRCACVALVSLTACERSADRRAPTSKPAATLSKEAEPAILPPGTGPDARTPLGPVKPAIDPKSAEAAGQVVQHYGALIEQRRWSEAAKLWSDKAAADAFARQLNHPETHLQIGKPGDTEGAAGSIYTTVPVVFYGDTFSRKASVILRRVNDVPGSTEAQRRWHIERIDWSAVA
jgi:hypothetical protein